MRECKRTVTDCEHIIYASEPYSLQGHRREKNTKSNLVIRTLLEHRSIRKYEEKSPSDEVLETIVRADQKAPFASQAYSVLLSRNIKHNTFKALLLFTICVDVQKWNYFATLPTDKSTCAMKTECVPSNARLVSQNKLKSRFNVHRARFEPVRVRLQL